VDKYHTTNCLDFDDDDLNVSQKARREQKFVLNMSGKESKLDDLEDIPQIFIEGFDPFMITTSIKNRALLEKVQDAMILGRRPKSARLLIASADNRRHVGFSGGKPRPYSAVPKNNIELEGIYENNQQNPLFLRGSYRIPSPISYSSVERRDN
jgi:hypothetical protein